MKVAINNGNSKQAMQAMLCPKIKTKRVVHSCEGVIEVFKNANEDRK
jgi:hypothetical protein